MGSSELLVIGLIGIPIILVWWLRVNAAMVFLSLCLGYVMVQFLGADVRAFAELFMPDSNVSTSVCKLVLLLAPAVLTAAFMMRSVKGSRRLWNMLPAIAVGTFTALLVVPLLASETTRSIAHIALWQQFLRAQDLVVTAGAIISLLFLWMQRPRPSEAKRKSTKD